MFTSLIWRSALIGLFEKITNLVHPAKIFKMLNYAHRKISEMEMRKEKKEREKKQHKERGEIRLNGIIH